LCDGTAFPAIRAGLAAVGIDFVAKPTLLITGATGFVGSHLLESYAAGEVALRALVRRPSDAASLEARGLACVLGSLEQEAALAEAVRGAEVVLHLAAATKGPSPEAYERTNAGGTRALVQAMLAAAPRPVRLVYLSSLAAAGPSMDGRPITHRHPPNPLTAYGRTKLEGERVCQEASGELEVVILRAPAVYGPGDRDVFLFFRLARYGIIPEFSGPPRTLQLIHVADLVRALQLAAVHEGARGLYHVAEERAYAWKEVGRMVADAVGGRARTLRVPGALVKGAAALSEALADLVGRSTIFNRDKALELLAPGWLCETSDAFRDFGFRAEIPLQEGLRSTAAWYREQGWLPQRPGTS
jgi:nucleoside-diphosphate-sugar epimerase